MSAAAQRSSRPVAAQCLVCMLDDLCLRDELLDTANTTAITCPRLWEPPGGQAQDQTGRQGWLLVQAAGPPCSQSSLPLKLLHYSRCLGCTYCNLPALPLAHLQSPPPSLWSSSRILCSQTSNLGHLACSRSVSKPPLA